MMPPSNLTDLVASGWRRGRGDGVHGGFRAAGAETHHLDGKALADFFRELPFQVMRHAEHGAGGQALPDGFHHRGMAVPGHERAETEVVVNVIVAVEIAEMRTLAFFDKDRIGIIGAIVARDAQR